MKKGKRRVRRLALYLRSIGIQPIAAGTQSQYEKLEPEQRKLARRTGRQLLIQFGSIAKAIMALTNHVVQEALAINSPPVVPRNRSREVFSQPQPLVPAHSCLSVLPDGVRLSKAVVAEPGMGRRGPGRQHDRDRLRVFKYPVQPGFWHLGHIGRDADSPVIPEESSLPSIPPNSLPPIPFQAGGHA